MSMSREEALCEEEDRRCIDRRSISFPGRIGESPDDWPALGPVHNEDEEVAAQCDQCPEPMEGPHHPDCYRFVPTGEQK